MIARITLILTMLLSTAHSPFCRCSDATDVDVSAQASQSRECSHCSEQESGSLPCPARPDCCCRASRMLMVADLQDSDFTRDSNLTGGILLDADREASLSAVHLHDMAIIFGELPKVDSGGRARLMRTCRLQI